jgi:hypothetical protein
MFGINPAAWLTEHHREHTTLVAAAMASHTTPPSLSPATPSAAPQLVCC